MKLLLKLSLVAAVFFVSSIQPADVLNNVVVTTTSQNEVVVLDAGAGADADAVGGEVDSHIYQVGTASWYGGQFHGRKTASGETYNMYEMTAAHKTLPLNSKIKVTNLNNNKSVILKVTDRGPYIGRRVLDVSYAAAEKLGFKSKGLTKVKIEKIF